MLRSFPSHRPRHLKCVFSSPSRSLADSAQDELIESTLFAERLASVDMIASLFAEGGLDPCALPDHPCPPGKKDRTMRTDLMPFQVRPSPALALLTLYSVKDWLG